MNLDAYKGDVFNLEYRYYKFHDLVFKPSKIYNICSVSFRLLQSGFG